MCRADECVAGVLGSEDFLPLTQEGHGLQVSSEVKNKVQLPMTYPYLLLWLSKSVLVRETKLYLYGNTDV